MKINGVSIHLTPGRGNDDIRLGTTVSTINGAIVPDVAVHEIV